MAKQRHTAEQIISKLREAEVPYGVSTRPTRETSLRGHSSHQLARTFAGESLVFEQVSLVEGFAPARAASILDFERCRREVGPAQIRPAIERCGG